MITEFQYEKLELLHEIMIPNYVRKVLISKSRRAKYFLYPKDERVREKKKYNSNRYQWKEYKLSTGRKEIRLFDTAVNDFVIKNSRVAGTEKWEVINAQKVYNGGYNEHTLGKIVKTIAASFIPSLQALPPINQYPLYLVCEIYDYIDDPISGSHWDVINRGYLYCKVFDDVIQPKTEKNPLGIGLIEDDSCKHVRCPSHPVFYPLDDEDKLVSIEPHLKFKIFHICQ